MSSRRTKSQSIGQPGLSARAAYRTRKARFQQMPWRKRLALLAVAAAGGAFIAFLGKQDIVAGALVATGLAVVVAILLAAPKALQIGGVLFGYFAFSYLIAQIYALAAASQSGIHTGTTATLYQGDVLGAALSLNTAAILAAWVSVRFSRGRAWVTLALALGATIIVGIPVLMVVPSLGDWAAFGSIAVVLAFRCGGWAWISGATGLLISRVIHRQEKEVEVQDSEVLAAWARREKAEQQTAEVLDHLDANHVIFHDVRVGKHPNALSHVVIGPAGVFLVSSISTRGPITETAASGVQISNVPLGVVVTTLLEQRHIVARLLKMKEQDLNVLVAIQPEKSNAFDPAIRRTLAVFGENDGELPFAQVVLAGPDALLAEVAPGLELVPRLTRATIIRRAKMRLVPAGAPTPSRWESSGTVRLSPVGQDGQAVAPVDLFANVDLSWISPGTSVDISTNAGVLRDLVVVSDPYTDRNGFLVVSLCVEEEWASALRAGRQPRAYPYPVSSIAPAA